MKKLLIILLILTANNLLGQMPDSISKTDKIFGLSKFWQEVNYNFAFLDKIDRKLWDSTYKKLIDEVQVTPNDYEYYRLLDKFCGMLNDGHTNVYMPTNIREKLGYSEFGNFRMFLNNIEGKAVVTKISQSHKNIIPIGSEIVKVNGFKTLDYIEQFVKPYIASSTNHVRDDKGVRGLFLAPWGTSFEIQLKLPNSKIKNLKLTLSRADKDELYPATNDEWFEFKWLENGIAYLNLGSFDSDYKVDSLFISILPELYKARKLIIDLRNNLGGSTRIGFNILQYLIPDNYITGLKLNSRVHIPAYKAWGRWTSENDTIGNKDAVKEYLSFRDAYYEEIPIELGEVKIKDKRIVIPTAVLIGHNTASAAEDFLLFTDNQQHFTTIGVPTYGSTGQPLWLRLPGGGSARICTLKNTYTDGREFIGIGILPDIEVQFTLKDFLENNDPVLERAIKFLNQ